MLFRRIATIGTRARGGVKLVHGPEDAKYLLECDRLLLDR